MTAKLAALFSWQMRRVHDTKPALQGLSGTRRAYSDKPCGKRLDSHHHRTFTSHTRKGIDIILIRTAGRTRHRSPARLKLCTHPAKCRGHEDQPRTRSRGLACRQGTRTGGAVDRYGRSPQIPPPESAPGVPKPRTAAAPRTAEGGTGDRDQAPPKAGRTHRYLRHRSLALYMRHQNLQSRIGHN
jgi:hypothetical protein